MPGKKINPYKAIAQLHNEGVHYVITKISQESEPSREQILGAVCEYLQITGQLSKVDSAINYASLASLLNKKCALDSDRIKALDISKRSKDYLKTLLSLSTLRKDMAETRHQLQKLEQEILNSDMTGKDSAYPLLFIAIAEESIELWAKEEKKKKSLWGKLKRVLKHIPWKADAKGAVEAAIDPGIEIIFSAEAVNAGVTVLKILGHSIYASVEEYLSQSKEGKGETINEKTKEDVSTPENKESGTEDKRSLTEKRIDQLRERAGKQKREDFQPKKGKGKDKESGSTNPDNPTLKKLQKLPKAKVILKKKKR